MTTVVVTSKYILADCRISFQTETTDQAGVRHLVKSHTDDYTKIGYTKKGEASETDQVIAWAVFGDINIATAILELVRKVGVTNLKHHLSVLGKFGYNPPKVPSGIVFLDVDHQMWYAYLQGNEWRVAAIDDNEHWVVGSGADAFNVAFDLTRDIGVAFSYAIEHDDKSSSGVYDRYYVGPHHCRRITVEDNYGMDSLRKCMTQRNV